MNRNPSFPRPTDPVDDRVEDLDNPDDGEITGLATAPTKLQDRVIPAQLIEGNNRSHDHPITPSKSGVVVGQTVTLNMQYLTRLETREGKRHATRAVLSVCAVSLGMQLVRYNSLWSVIAFGLSIPPLLRGFWE